MNTLQKLKLYLDIKDNSKDDLLTLMIEDTQAEISKECNTDYTSLMENVLIKMVIFKYNQKGTEGLSGESYSGASYTYLTDYPDTIKKNLSVFRKLRCI